MDRKLLIVFALTFLVLIFFRPLLNKYAPQPPAKTESAQTQQNQAPLPSQSLTPTTSSTSAAPHATAAPGSVPAQQAATESESVIENDDCRVVFTNRGGRVKSWVLKKYTDDKGGPLELVNATAAEKYGYPLTLWSYDDALRNKLNSALYVAKSTGTTAPAEIKFTFADGDVSVEKTYTFDRNSYVVGVKTAVYEKGEQVTAFPMWPAGFGSDVTGPQYASAQVIYQYDDKIERLAIKKVSGNG